MVLAHPFDCFQMLTKCQVKWDEAQVSDEIFARDGLKSSGRRTWSTDFLVYILLLAVFLCQTLFVASYWLCFRVFVEQQKGEEILPLDHTVNAEKAQSMGRQSL